MEASLRGQKVQGEPEEMQEAQFSLSILPKAAIEEGEKMWCSYSKSLEVRSGRWTGRSEPNVLLHWQWVSRILSLQFSHCSTAWSSSWVQLWKGSSEWVTNDPAFQMEDQKGKPQETGKYSKEHKDRGVWERNPVKLFLNKFRAYPWAAQKWIWF